MRRRLNLILIPSKWLQVWTSWIPLAWIRQLQILADLRDRMEARVHGGTHGAGLRTPTGLQEDGQEEQEVTPMKWIITAP